MKVSILVPFIRRTELLKNSLRTLTTQTYDDVEIILIDDGSPTNEIELLAKKLGVVYNRLRGPGEEPRIPNKAWLKGFDICRGDFIVITYAEILVPRNAVELMMARNEVLSRDGDARFPGYDFKKLGARLIPIQYCLSPEIQKTLDDKFDFDNLDALKDAPGFWEFYNHWGWTNKDAANWRHHCAFTGAPRHLWEAIGSVEDTESWLADIENEVTKRQHEAKRRLAAVEYGVYHQYHPRERPGDPAIQFQTQKALDIKKDQKEQERPTPGPVVTMPEKKTRKEQARPTPGPPYTIIEELIPEMSVRMRRIKGLVE